MYFSSFVWQYYNFSNSFAGTCSSDVKPIPNLGRRSWIWLMQKHIFWNELRNFKFIHWLLTSKNANCMCYFRYLSCGAWAGKIFCLVMIFSFMLWHLLELWEVYIGCADWLQCVTHFAGFFMFAVLSLFLCVVWFSVISPQMILRRRRILFSHATVLNWRDVAENSTIQKIRRIAVILYDDDNNNIYRKIVYYVV